MSKEHAKLSLKSLVLEGLKECASPVDLSLAIFNRWQTEGHPVERKYILPFIAINSDTDHLPSIDTEKLWQPEALKHKLEEKKEYDAFYLSDFQKACEALIQKLN
ncbi:hypothetical protein [Parasphingorhabdus sp.]|uniref:hypothetical protein n=1 Tax=Parasphingorhabdus sp. TaxID=2709688 RepID=UPI00300137B2